MDGDTTGRTTTERDDPTRPDRATRARGSGRARHGRHDGIWLRQIERHGGVAFVDELVGAGMPRGAVYRRLRTEGWQQLLPGAYADPRASGALRKRMYAIQHRYPALVASHRSAAALLGIAVLDHDLELTRIGKGGSQVAGAKVHLLSLSEKEVTHLEYGLRVTSPLRTVADLLRGAPLVEAVVAADSALRQRLVTFGGLLEAARAEGGRRGEERALRALAAVDPAAQSVAESAARVRIREAGLRPECQAELRAVNGRLLRADFLFRAAGLVVEIEGYPYHGTRWAHQQDAHRFNQLSMCAGVRRILRFTARDALSRPQWMIRTIEQALGELETGGAGPAPALRGAGGAGGAGAGASDAVPTAPGRPAARDGGRGPAARTGEEVHGPMR